MNQPEVVLVGSDNVVELREVKNYQTGAYITDGTATFQVFETDGTTSVDGPNSMSYVAGSNATYRGTLADTVSLTDNKRYRVKVIFDAGAGLKRVFNRLVIADAEQ